jgi:hypothetical protein
MAFLSFLKKKPKQESLDLPPPPAPESAMQPAEVRIVNELPSMEQLPELPEEAPAAMELPSMPEHEEAPMPELEEAPAEMPEPEERPVKARPVTRKEPLFVNVEDYQNVLTSINYVRSKLGEAEDLVRKLNDIKAVEEKNFEAWRNQLEDVQRKLAYVENVVFEAGV